MTSDNKVIQFKVEPDLSDAHVMNALREGIKFSKSRKCKSIYIMIIPEEVDAIEGNTFMRSSTRTSEKDVGELLTYCYTGLGIFRSYARGLFGYED